jgi:predicted transcriptional regulator
MKRRLISEEDADARLVQEREARLAALDASIARGVADADAGRVTSISDLFDRLETRLKMKMHSAPDQKG